MTLSPNQKEVMMFFVFLALISSGLLGLQHFQIARIRSDYQGNLAAIEQDLKTLQQQFDRDTVALHKDINDQSLIVDQKLERVTSSNRKVVDQLNTVQVSSNKNLLDLTEQIQDVESKNNEKLQEIAGRVGTTTQDSSLIIEFAMPSVVSVNTVRGKGTGIIISEEGYVVTNYHVIQDTAHLSGTTNDRRDHALHIVDYDEASDVALLKFDDKTKHTPIQIRDSSSLKPGERVFTIGSPLGLDFSVTEGIVSSARRIGNGGIPFIQSDITINPGNSGGPLLDANGKMVGMNTLKVADIEGIGFALPAEFVMSIAERMVRNDKGKK